MSTHQTGGDSNPHFRIEGDAAVLETQIEKIEREQREAREREATYAQTQLTINNQQLRVNTLLMVFTGFLLLTSILSGAIAIWEAHIAQEGANAAETSAKTAQDMFDAIASPDGQFDRQMRQIIHQTSAQVESANSAKSAAETAKETLHLSERAYIAFGAPQMDYAKKTITLEWINTGHIPSGPVEVIAHEATFNLTSIGAISHFNEAIEKNWMTAKWERIDQTVPVYFEVAINAMIPRNVQTGLQAVTIAGHISYTDGFPDAPTQTQPFCVQTVYQPLTKVTNLSPCVPSYVIPQMEAVDGYPKTKPN